MSSFEILINNTLDHYEINAIRLKKSVETVLANEKLRKARISVVLTEDDTIINLNKKFLNKDDTTDVLSFEIEKNDKAGLIEGEIYANLNQIERQAVDYNVSFESELFRIVIHGVLHLIGYDDKLEKDLLRMREKEDHYLSLVQNGFQNKCN